MIKRILVGLGGTGFTPVAIRRAVELGQIHDARVTAVTVVDAKRLQRVGPVPLGGATAAHELREHRWKVTADAISKAIGEFEEACDAAGVKYSVRQERGDPFDLMLSCARYHDLMLFGLRSIFDYGILGDEQYEPSNQLSRLITGGVRPIIATAERYRPIRRVLIGYSGSKESARVLKRFVQLRLWPDLVVRIVTFQDSVENGKQLCDEAAAYCRDHGLEPEVEYCKGSPKTELLSKAAEWQADMLALSNSARSLLSRRIFGDTAIHVIRNAGLPLFLHQ